MKKKILAVILIILSLVFTAIIGYKAAKNNTDIHVYKLETTTNDLIVTLENMRFVSCGSNLYIEPNFVLRVNNNDYNKIEALNLTVTIDNNTIPNLTLTTALNDKNCYIDDSGYKLKNITMNKDSVVNLHFNYVKNGQTYDYNQAVILQEEEF